MVIKNKCTCFPSFTFPLAAWAPPGDDDLEALKAKNIKQTELVADLREAILQVARHFQCVDPKNCIIVSGNSLDLHYGVLQAWVLSVQHRTGLFKCS